MTRFEELRKWHFLCDRGAADGADFGPFNFQDFFTFTRESASHTRNGKSKKKKK